MTESFVGIVSRLGLEGLWSEEEHAMLFLLRRARRIQDRQAACIWVVIDVALARRVMEQLHLGNRYDALVLLQTVAVDLGLVFPERKEPVFHAT